MITIRISLLIFAPFIFYSTALSQPPQKYVLQKTITIPVGSGEGNISVEYCVLGRYAALPDAILIEADGSIIVGSHLQKYSIQKFTPDGQFNCVMTVQGSEKTNVNYPFRIVTDTGDNLYVLEKGRILSNGNVSQCECVKKFGADGCYRWAVPLETIVPNPGINDRINGIRVTPDGCLIMDCWVLPDAPHQTTDRWQTTEKTYTLDETGKVLQRDDKPMYVDDHSGCWTLAYRQRGNDIYCMITRLRRRSASQQSVDTPLWSQRRPDTVMEYSWHDAASTPIFLGFDRQDNLYFYRMTIRSASDTSRNRPDTSEVEKYTPEMTLLARCKYFGKFRRKPLIDSEGNIYVARTIVKDQCHYTPGDRLEIEKWVAVIP
jgi:hypothetical protein